MFTDSLNKYNSGELEVSSINESTYTYENYIDDMYKLGRELQESVNEYCRIINEAAVEESVNNNKNDNTELKESFIEKLKNAWHVIVEKTLQMFDKIYDFMYEQLVLHKNFIKKNEDKIMNTNIIYRKNESPVYECETDPNNKDKIIHQKKLRTGSREIIMDRDSYKNILNPDFILPYLHDTNNMENYIDSDGRIDKEKINNEYKEKILGSKDKSYSITINEINDHKKEMIKNLDVIYNRMKTNRATIRQIINKRKNPPENITPEEVNVFKQSMMNDIDSTKEYNKVLLEYCKEISNILKMYVTYGRSEDE